MSASQPGGQCSLTFLLGAEEHADRATMPMGAPARSITRSNLHYLTPANLPASSTVSKGRRVGTGQPPLSSPQSRDSGEVFTRSFPLRRKSPGGCYPRICWGIIVATAPRRPTKPFGAAKKRAPRSLSSWSRKVERRG